ncbi:MAG: reverse transcriptase family protein [Gammaproteobacteria bacterium]|nr:reverse transcriptase family protein [Gammaproteobacteria bacterium]
MTKRGEYKRRDPNSDANRSEYSRLNKLVKKSSKIDDNNWALRMATDLEDASSKGQQREVWQKIYVIANKKKKKSAAVRDRSGQLIADPHAQKERWKEHFSELFNPPPQIADISDLDNVMPQLSFDYLSNTDEAPTRDEVVDALKKLKNYKSPGIDGITNEQLKYGESGLADELVRLFAKVWETEEIPEDWSKGVVVVVGKKGDNSYCSNNRGITLRSTTSKVLQIILLKRLQSGLEQLLRENQCGFRQNRSCIDQIYSLRCIIHQCLEYNIPLYINFVDFKAAFDSINRQFIWRSFEHYGMPEKYIRMMKAFFSHTVSAVKVNGELTDWFSVNSGTGQGDIQGPPVFNFCLNFSAYLMELHKVISKGATLQKPTSEEEEVTLLDADYADDMALLDNAKEGLQETTDLLCKYSAYAGLKVNAEKTQTMAVSKTANQRPYTEKDTLDINVEGLPIEQVSNFKYLGTIISGDGTIDKELSTRIQKASGAFNLLGSIWHNRNIKTSTKIRIYKAAVLTILLYGSEVWNTTQTQMKRFQVFHHRCLRRILKIKWYYHVSNKEVLRRANINPIEVFIRASRLRWFGHVVRMSEERIPRYLLKWMPKHGKRSRGKLRKNWLTCVLEDASIFTGVNNITLDRAEQLASDRVQWRSLIRRNKEFLCGAGHSND